jgi:hypothetical protein
MTTIINGSSPSVTFSDGTTQTTAGLPLTGGTVTGNVTVTGNIIQGANAAPAFYAYRATTNQTGISINTWTRVQLNAELFDTNNNFDSTTNYRFTPTVAGYYQLNASILFTLGSGTSSVTLVGIYKNGSIYIQNECTATVPNGHSIATSTLMYMNGTTDYAEMYGYVGNADAAFTLNPQNTAFCGSFVRSA